MLPSSMLSPGEQSIMDKIFQETKTRGALIFPQGRTPGKPLAAELSRLLLPEYSFSPPRQRLPTQVGSLHHQRPFFPEASNVTWPSQALRTGGDPDPERMSSPYSPRPASPPSPAGGCKRDSADQQSFSLVKFMTHADTPARFPDHNSHPQS